MKRIAIDFAPMTPSRVAYLTTSRTWLMLIMGCGLCLFVGLKVQNTIHHIDSQQRVLSQLAMQTQKRATQLKPTAHVTIPESQSLSVSHAIEKLNLPWQDVLDAIEAATPNTIALISLEPDTRRRVIKGTAEAKTSDDMIFYVEQLKKQSFFVNVFLTKHDINEQDTNRPLRFQFEATWQVTP